jgi:rhamnulokinase
VAATPARARATIDSLANHYVAALEELEATTGLRARGLQILGGGSRNRYLCEKISELSGLPVLAGPAEATAIGNLMIQARVLGIVTRETEITCLPAAGTR